MQAISSPSRVFAVLAIASSLACQRLPISDETGVSNAAGDEGVGDESQGTFAGGQDDGGQDDGADTSGVPQGECDPVAQTGCDEDQKCTVVRQAGALTYRCVGDIEIRELWGSCESNLSDGRDGCPAGSVCLPGELGGALCVPICESTNDCVDAICVPDAATLVRFCAPLCSPLDVDCFTGMQCRRYDDAFACQFPREPDVGGAGTLCSTVDDRGCTEGFACVTGAVAPDCEEAQCCSPICDTAADTCSGEASCTQLLDDPAPGYEHIGVCALPI